MCYQKYLVTGDKSVIKGKDAILSDRDITISYETIKLTENIRMQIRNFQVKDNEAKLILAVNEESLEKDTKVVPLRYKVYNSSNELLCDKRSAKAYNQYLSEYTEELILNNYNQEDNILLLEVYKSNDERLAKITIDLNTREITIDGEEEALQKVSEIELKKYLSYITKYEDCKDNDDLKLVILRDIFSNLKNDFGKETEEYGSVYEVSEINNMLDSLGYEKLPESLNSGELFKKVKVKGINYYSICITTIKFSDYNKLCVRKRIRKELDFNSIF